MTGRDSALSRILQSPTRILAIMLLVVFVVEVAVMSILPWIVPDWLGPAGHAIFDAALLTLACAPVLWWMIVGPLQRIAIQEQARAETIVANAGEGILTITGQGRVATANRVALALFQLSPNELIRQPIATYIPDLSLNAEMVGRQTKLTGIRSDRAEFPLLISVSRLSNGLNDSFIVILRDLTEAYQSEEERVQAAREREALRAQQMTTLAQLATGVAHEIRNPLTSIKMLIQVNRTMFADAGLPTADLELVEQEIRRMERSVNGLLEYGRPEQQQNCYFQVSEVIEKTRRLIEGRSFSENTAVHVHQPDEPLTLDGDPAQIQQLLLNLSLNALDAMPAGGVLTFSVRAIPDKFAVSIAVTDTGTGLSDKVLDQLFSPFVTTKPNGVGLGLGICRRIAEAHQGTLTGSNQPSGGACFELTLPLVSMTKTSQQASHVTNL